MVGMSWTSYRGGIQARARAAQHVVARSYCFPVSLLFLRTQRADRIRMRMRTWRMDTAYCVLCFLRIFLARGGRGAGLS